VCQTLGFCDGDVFRYYNEALAQDDRVNAQKWMARLSVRKRKNLLQLERYHGGKLFVALRDPIPFAGLWPRFQLGAFNRILPMHCPEVGRAR